MKKFLAFLLYFPFPGALLAQATPAGEPLSVKIDYACFRSESSSRLEIYYSLSSGELALTRSESLASPEGKSYALVLANLDLFTADGKPFDSLSKTTAFRVARADTTYEFSEILILSPSPGNYRARIEIFDLQSGKKGRDSLDVLMENLNEPGFRLSSLQLARLIVDKKKSPGFSFYERGSWRVVPNAARGYTQDDPRLYYYLEIYGLTLPEAGFRNFEIRYSVINEAGETLKTSGFLKRPKEEIAAAVGSVNLAGLPPGEYFLKIDIRDPSEGKILSRDKSFSLFPPSQYPEAAEEELQYFPEAASYLLTTNEKRIYAASNRTGKLNFIAEFWKKHDPTPEIPENDYQQEVYARYSKANNRFSQTTTSQDGWKTDRGRVLMLYGEPNNEDRFPASASNLPWEKWEYNRIAGGLQALFVFVDLRGLGNYQLVHSTAPGEKQNPAWEDMINQNVLRR